MTDQDMNVEATQERLTLFALGMLPENEAQELIALLRDNPSLQAEAGDLQITVQEIAFAAPEISPSPNVRTQLLANIAAANHTPVTSAIHPSTHHDVRVDEGEWVTMYPGIFCKTLFVEPTNGYITTLMKMEPGASVPNHHHRGAEQCLVLSGEITMNERHYRAGDFTVMLAGSDHLALQSPTGGMVLLVSPPDYESVSASSVNLATSNRHSNITCELSLSIKNS